jgi:hypothetical protein
LPVALGRLVVGARVMVGSIRQCARERTRGARPVARLPAEDRDWPRIDLIVPLHNEAAGVAQKIRNTAALAYPATRLRIWLVDGASNDGTAERARACIVGDQRFRLLSVPVANKTIQLNAALRHAIGDWVMVSDADARLPRHTLESLVLAAMRDPRLGVVGTPVRPVHAHPIERVHWTISNWTRRVEAAIGVDSLVMAPCYLFRRALVPGFPVDVVADDVHVALTVAGAGWRVGMVPVTVRELRTPRSLVELFRHKQRKVADNLREVLRALRAPDGRPCWSRGSALCHFAHLVAAPALVLVGIGGVGLLGYPVGLLSLAVVCGVVLAGLLPPIARRLPAILLVPSLAFLLAVVTIVAVARLALGSRWAMGAPRPSPSPLRLRGDV